MLSNPTTNIGSVINCYNKNYQSVNSILIIEALMELQRCRGSKFEVSQIQLLSLSGIPSVSPSPVCAVLKKLKNDGILLVEKGGDSVVGQRTSNTYTIDYDRLESEPELLWDTNFKLRYHPSGVPVIGHVLNCYNERYRNTNAIRVIEHLMSLQSTSEGVYEPSKQTDMLWLTGISGSVSKVSNVLRKLEGDRIISIRRGKRRMINFGTGKAGTIINKISQYTVNYQNLSNSPDLLWDVEKVNEELVSDEYMRLFLKHKGGMMTTQGIASKAI